MDALMSTSATAPSLVELEATLFDELGGIVQSGPFAGMKILAEQSWKDARLLPMLLGCHEEELHGELERQLARLKRMDHPIVSVVGSAEGYYAIGIKCRVPQAVVYAVDPDERANELCMAAARLNGVALAFGASVDELMTSSDLIFMDCEGNECVYLDVDRFPALKGKNIIVEVHNLPKQKTDEILFERFRGTHHITMVFEGPRNPNKYQALIRYPSDQRWLAVSENRPCFMAWFIMEPKGLSLS